jgi:hypothetical protein
MGDEVDEALRREVEGTRRIIEVAQDLQRRIRGGLDRSKRRKGSKGARK